MVELRNKKTTGATGTIEKRKYNKRRRSKSLEIERLDEANEAVINQETVSNERPDNDSELNSSIGSQSKRSRASYEILKSFETKADVDAFIRVQNNFNLIITHNEPVNCSLCKQNDHSMTQIYKKFKCRSCDLK